MPRNSTPARLSFAPRLWVPIGVWSGPWPLALHSHFTSFRGPGIGIRIRFVLEFRFGATPDAVSSRRVGVRASETDATHEQRTINTSWPGILRLRGGNWKGKEAESQQFKFPQAIRFPLFGAGQLPCLFIGLEIGHPNLGTTCQMLLRVQWKGILIPKSIQL